MSLLQNKISQAKAKLLVQYPYFGTLASKLELVANEDIQAFKSNGVKLEYNPDFFARIEPEEMAFVFANGAMHASLAHERRKNNRSGWLWQMATDFAINDMLSENGLMRPDEAQYRKRFCGMYAEEIYAELKDDLLREDENLEYEADDVEDVQKEHKENIQEEILQEQLLAEEAISRLTSEAARGDAPKSMERFFTLELQGKIDWRNELKAALDRYFKDDFVLIPPSKKFLYQGIYIPSSISQTFRLVIAVDSSGSVDEALLNSFLSEVNFLMGMVQNYQIELLVCDDRLHSHQTFFTGDSLECKLVGGGGTNYKPVFEFIEQELWDLKLLLYFTDLEGIFPKEKPNYEVKWVSPKESEIPFGTLILLED
jgi:predicted metal-dependent peptidase